MSQITRRRFCTALSALLLGVSVSACSGMQPRPFVAGKTTRPPIGCTELRKRDPAGDC